MSHCPKVQKWQFFQEFLQICRKKREGLTFWKRKVAAPSGTVRHGPAPSGCPPARSACHTAPSGGHPAASRGHPAPCRWHLAPSRGHPLQYGGCPAPYRGRLASYGGCLAPSEVLWPSPEGTELTLGLPRSSILGFFLSKWRITLDGSQDPSQDPLGPNLQLFQRFTGITIVIKVNRNKRNRNCYKSLRKIIQDPKLRPLEQDTSSEPYKLGRFNWKFWQKNQTWTFGDMLHQETSYFHSAWETPSSLFSPWQWDKKHFPATNDIKTLDMLSPDSQEGGWHLLGVFLITWIPDFFPSFFAKILKIYQIDLVNWYGPLDDEVGFFHLI